MTHTVQLANGVTVPALGQGTWYLGDDPSTRAREIDAIRQGIDAGMTLIDTAEMYGGGRSEDLVGEAISTVDRGRLFLVSKVLPQNAGGRKLGKALDATLERMGVEQLDLYLYHWRGSYSLRETVDCLEEQKALGRIKAWGVSNFDIDDMGELFALPGGQNCLVNQVLYHTGSRGIEFSLLPWMKEHRVALMSYCPLAQAGSLERSLFRSPVLRAIADKHGVPVSQVLLAWNIRDGQTIAIPRSSRPEHTLANAGADRLELTEEELQVIDEVYPKPTQKEWLDMQ